MEETGHCSVSLRAYIKHYKWSHRMDQQDSSMGKGLCLVTWVKSIQFTFTWQEETNFTKLSSDIQMCTVKCTQALMPWDAMLMWGACVTPWHHVEDTNNNKQLTNKSQRGTWLSQGHNTQHYSAKLRRPDISLVLFRNLCVGVCMCPVFACIHRSQKTVSDLIEL